MRTNRFVPLLVLAFAIPCMGSDAIAEATGQPQKGKWNPQTSTKDGKAAIQTFPWTGQAVTSCGPVTAFGGTQSDCDNNLTQAIAATRCTMVSREICHGKSTLGPTTSVGGVLGPLSPVDPSTVSNGCGAKGKWQGIENIFGDTMIIPAATGKLRFTINVRPACDLHDAGYAGIVVYDTITGNGATRDYRALSRSQVDSMFRDDIRTLCDKAITNPVLHAVALTRCKGLGVLWTLSGVPGHGAEDYYQLVRNKGGPHFDQDPTTSGIQHSGPRIND